MGRRNTEEGRRGGRRNEGDVDTYKLSVHYKQNPTFYFDMSRGIVIDADNVESGNQVKVITDLSGNGHTAVQETDAKQGTMGVDADGNATIDVDGNADCYGLSAGGGWPSGNDLWFWVDCNPTNASGTAEYLLDFGTGALVLAHLTDTSGKTGFYDGSWVSVADAASGEQSLEWHFDDSGTDCEMYRTGVYIGTGAFAGSIAMGGTVAAFSDNAQTAGFFEGEESRKLGRDSLPTTTELFESRQQRATDNPTMWADTLPLVVPVGPDGCWFDTSAAGNFVLDGTDIIVAKDCSRNLDDPVSNGDFETGDPPSNWNAAGAILSAETASPYEGLQNLRVTSAGSPGYTTQTAITSGQRCMYKLMYRSDGTAYGRAIVGGVSSGNISNTSWTELLQVIDPVSSEIRLYKYSTAGNWVEFDTVEVTPGNHGYQATSANRPTWDAVNLCANAAAANSEFLDLGTTPPVAGVTFTAWVRMTDLSSAYSLWGSIDGSGNGCYVQIQTDGTIDVVCGTETLSSTETVSSGTWAHVVATISPTEMTITIDGTTETSPTISETLSTADCYLFAHNNNGTDANHANCDLSGPEQIPHVATAAEISYLYALGRNP